MAGDSLCTSYLVCVCVCDHHCVGLAEIRIKAIKKRYEERLREARERGEHIEEPSDTSSSSGSEEEEEETVSTDEVCDFCQWNHLGYWPASIFYAVNARNTKLFIYKPAAS